MYFAIEFLTPWRSASISDCLVHPFSFSCVCFLRFLLLVDLGLSGRYGRCAQVKAMAAHRQHVLAASLSVLQHLFLRHQRIIAITCSANVLRQCSFASHITTCMALRLCWIIAPVRLLGMAEINAERLFMTHVRWRLSRQRSVAPRRPAVAHTTTLATGGHVPPTDDSWRDVALCPPLIEATNDGINRMTVVPAAPLKKPSGWGQPADSSKKPSGWGAPGKGWGMLTNPLKTNWNWGKNANPSKTDPLDWGPPIDPSDLAKCRGWGMPADPSKASWNGRWGTPVDPSKTPYGASGCWGQPIDPSSDRD